LIKKSRGESTTTMSHLRMKFPEGPAKPAATAATAQPAKLKLK